tara:strand:+ start:469 stop:711 length:243 start_codon:yes stop_codon:yes gene_type:complete
MELSYKRTSYKQWKAIIDSYIAKLRYDADWLEKCSNFTWKEKFKIGMLPPDAIEDEIGWADDEWLSGFDPYILLLRGQRK